MTVTLFHSHGIGRFDYSSLRPDDLEEVDTIAGRRGLLVCPTVFLRRDHLNQFVTLMSTYGDRSQKGELPHILGFSIEGPFLGPEGGIPRSARWSPTPDEWRTIISLGSHGLRYLVIAPDAMELDEAIGADYTFRDLLRECYDGGVRIALGHFQRDSPMRSATRVEALLAYLHEHYESSPYLVLTDHLYNDMPRNFIHAWRTEEERRRRDEELGKFLTAQWKPENLVATLGPVPATLLQAARDRLLTPSINFDGLHVDLQICRRTVSYLGSDRLIAMTDDTEVNVIADEVLCQVRYNSLLYRDDGVIAAGSCHYREQIANMESIGLSSDEITSMFGIVPTAALRFSPKPRR